MEDMKSLQTDYISRPAIALVPLLDKVVFENPTLKNAKDKLQNWNFELNRNSAEAAIYVAWENAMREMAFNHFADPGAKELVTYFQITKLIGWLKDPEYKKGEYLDIEKDSFIKSSFESAILSLNKRLGENMDTWKYGGENFKFVKIYHPLGKVVNDSIADLLNMKMISRGGNQYTPGATSGAYNQSHGATFRIIADVGHWDNSLFTNAPGQSGNPQEKYYKNLYETWANDEYLPLYYSRRKIEESADAIIVLSPAME